MAARKKALTTDLTLPDAMDLIQQCTMAALPAVVSKSSSNENADTIADRAIAIGTAMAKKLIS